MRLEEPWRSKHLRSLPSMRCAASSIRAARSRLRLRSRRAIPIGTDIAAVMDREKARQSGSFLPEEKKGTGIFVVHMRLGRNADVAGDGCINSSSDACTAKDGYMTQRLEVNADATRAECRGNSW